MYKRQDWLHLHGQQAAEDSSSDSEDSQPEETGTALRTVLNIFPPAHAALQ